MEPILTIFTPTYNRAHTLPLCYDSLKKQTNKNFIWLIIDDGSNDETKTIVNTWISENIIPIKYYWKPNGGMHTAHNKAFELATTELIFCLDSDDNLSYNAVQKIIDIWKSNNSKQYAGIIALQAYRNGKIIGAQLPKNVSSVKLYDYYYKYKGKGDKLLIYRTELVRKYPYPIFEGEKYVPLSYKYYNIDKDYDLIILNEVLYYKEYLNDGYTKNQFIVYKENPKGYAFYRLEMMKISHNIILRFKQAIHYVMSSLIAKNTKFMVDTPYKFLTLMAIIPGFILYLYINKTSKKSLYRK